MTSRDAPIPAGTLCTLDGRTVRVYATIEVGRRWDGTYRLFRVGERQSCGLATRDELVVPGELRRETIGPRTAWRALADVAIVALLPLLLYVLAGVIVGLGYLIERSL